MPPVYAGTLGLTSLLPAQPPWEALPILTTSEALLVLTAPLLPYIDTVCRLNLTILDANTGMADTYDLGNALSKVAPSTEPGLQHLLPKVASLSHNCSYCRKDPWQAQRQRVCPSPSMHAGFLAGRGPPQLLGAWTLSCLLNVDSGEAGLRPRPPTTRWGMGTSHLSFQLSALDYRIAMPHGLSSCK